MNWNKNENVRYDLQSFSSEKNLMITYQLGSTSIAGQDALSGSSFRLPKFEGAVRACINVSNREKSGWSVNLMRIVCLLHIQNDSNKFYIRSEWRKEYFEVSVSWDWCVSTNYSQENSRFEFHSFACRSLTSEQSTVNIWSNRKRCSSSRRKKNFFLHKLKYFSLFKENCILKRIYKFLGISSSLFSHKLSVISNKIYFDAKLTNREMIQNK